MGVSQGGGSSGHSLDEIGCLPIERNDAEQDLGTVAKLYEQASIIMT